MRISDWSSDVCSSDLQDGNVEGAAAKVVDGDGLAVLLFKPIGERGRRRLVDDAQTLKPRDLARVLGRLALRVVEIGGDGDHRLLPLFAQVGLGGFLHLLEVDAGKLRWRIVHIRIGSW